MENLAIFGIAMIVVIAIALQHLVNWLFRLSYKEDNAGPAAMGVGALILSLGILYRAIILAVELF